MEHILETLQNSPYAWAALSLITVISLILAIYFGISSKKVKRFYYFKKTNKLVSFNSNKPSSLHLFYDDTEIQDVSVTRIAVWNSGNDVINAEDLVESEPLSIKNKKYEDDFKILDTSIEYVTDKTNDFKLLPMKNSKDDSEHEKHSEDDSEHEKHSEDDSEHENLLLEGTVKFNYVEKRDGFILQVVHTGSPDNIYLDCRIKGGQNIYEIDKRGVKAHNLKDNERLYQFLKKQKILFNEKTKLEDYEGYSLLGYYIAWWTLMPGYCISIITLWLYPFFPRFTKFVFFVGVLPLFVIGIGALIYIHTFPGGESSPITIPKKLKKKL